MFLKTQTVLQNINLLSDGSLIKSFNVADNSSLKFILFEKDFKFILKRSLKKNTQSSNILNNYRKNIFK